jgi:pimeloyl-ACP methyl ester carboxylesterase
MRRCLILLVVSFAGLATAGDAAARQPGSFYRTAAVPVAHGQLIKSERISGGTLPSNGISYKVLYSSKSPAGKPVPVSGVVTIPKGKAPKGGFPVVSWAHGTTGIADSCAPSLYATDPPTGAYAKDFRKEAGGWIKHGFAVAQTDYQGLGTAGSHPYLIGTAEGRSVVDIVSAARHLSGKVGKRWLAIGHSQGGHATLWAAALAKHYAPGLDLVGAVPLAPASHIGEQAALIDTIQGNPLGGLPALIIDGAIHDLGVAPATVFSDKAMALYPQIEQVCLDKLSAQDSFGGLSLNELVRAGYDRQPLLHELAANDPEDLTIKVPLLIAQGKADTTVFPAYTDQTVSDLEGRGTKVTYKTYAGVTHSTVVQASRTDVDRFIDKLLAP